ncbi:ABC transporter substrate-binding protein [Planctomicrobium sp. SH664]|uniref:ABC transporter substrate-binding protein n=1 Tax=Planctomicrobium sp. SH664 TaxID=3448125 RepID=UPI003F5AEFE6
MNSSFTLTQPDVPRDFLRTCPEAAAMPSAFVFRRERGNRLNSLATSWAAMPSAFVFRREVSVCCRLRLLMGLFWLSAALTPLVAHAQDEPALPKLADLQVPTAQELLNEKRKDWVVLFTDEVLIVDPVTPRPDTLKKIEERVSQKEAERAKATLENRDRLLREIDDAAHLVLTLADVPSSPEYRIQYKKVREIIYYETNLLKRMSMLLQEQKIDIALELLTRLQRTAPTWPGVTEAYHQVLLADAEKRIAQGQPLSALIPLDELFERDKNYPGLSEQTGIAVQQLIEQAREDHDERRALFYLKRLFQNFPDHPVYQRYAAELAAQTRSTLQQAAAALQQGDPRQAAIEAEVAARIWPRAPELRSQYRLYTEKYQRLHVGVTSLPGENDAYPFPSAADLRRRELTELPLFEIDRVRDGTAYYRTRFFDEWEPLNLGKEMRFTLRQFRQPYEMQGVVTTADVVSPLLRRLDPSDTEFDERLSSFVESVIVESPTQFRLVFRRVPPRLEPLLSGFRLHHDNDDPLAIGPLANPGGFRLMEQTEQAATYLRVIPEPEASKRFHVAEVIEHRYDTPEKAVQALSLGEVSMLPQLPDWIIRRMQGDQAFLKDFFVLKSLVPTTHLLQFNPASRPLRNRELRTALSYGVDRERVLRDVILRDPTAAHGKTITTPFLSDSPGRNVLVQARRFDLSACLALTIAASKQLNEKIPPLTMIVAPGDEVEEAARQIAATWKRTGLQINLVYAHEPKPESWDIVYRTLQMTEPLVEMWPFLTFQEQARLKDLDIYPDWLKQELVQLDRTSDQSRAVNALQTLHRHLWDDTAYVPLWEIEQYFVLRKNIQRFPQGTPPGIRQGMVHCYDEIDHWTIDPWYQTELP